MNGVIARRQRLRVRWMIVPVLGLVIALAFLGLFAWRLWSRTAMASHSWKDCYHYWQSGGSASQIKTLPLGKVECTLPDGRMFTN